MNQLLRLNFANFVFHFARMFSGAIFFIILMEQGIGLATLSLAKGCQLMVSSILVVPCGVMADRWGGKSAVLIACGFSLIYYLSLIHPTVSKVILGEICNGVALASYIGAFESWIFSLAKEKNAIQLHTHLARTRELSYIAIICGGLVGAWMTNYVFLLSFIFMLCAGLLFLGVKKGYQAQAYETTKEKYFFTSFQELISKKIGTFFLISSFLVGGGMQLIYQFWQPFFLKFVPLNSSREVFGYIFVAFMLTQYYISRLVRKKFIQHAKQLLPLVGIMWIVAAIVLFGSIVTQDFYIACGCFCIFLGLTTAVGNLLTAYLGSLIDQKLQSTVISILDLAGKSLGTCFLFLGETRFMLSKFNYGWPILGIILFVMAFWVLVQRKKLCITETA